MEVTPEARPLIDGCELYRFYHIGDDETFALRGVSVSVHAGEMVAVVGPSGSGKSTLLACLAGLDEPDGGHVTIAGQRISRRDAGHPGQAAGPVDRDAAAVGQPPGAPQRGAEHPGRAGPRGEGTSGEGPRGHPEAGTVSDTGADGRIRPDGADPARRRRPGERASARPSTLSGGESARAGLAVAMANDPPVLLADEPTGEVDRQAETQVLQLLRGRADRGKAVLVVTHSERVAACADRIVRMVDGRITDE